ncbi:peptide ABC transporter substrate-binding protein [Amycolatopsis jiangsuensis]|uniref:Peptide/nickel transport system substrate-binding protein n=1 Tax=Amycolatopsis jiangsuensis TaxID=1181879 RepID=A0A840J1Q9_9PSEU|nr:peptide ABC transporter substrate-binding protein [Amycolatopsis jiangsuensis]MBB4688946.1 peptide/nickel transport system substrate-binding protein [Amycolatopsis jiangsuensis]
MVRGPWRAALGGALAGALLVSGCAGTAEHHGGGSGKPVDGGTVRFAMPPSATPNWIMPISIPGYGGSYNGAIRGTMYVPLYVYDGESGSVALDDRASAADPPRYSADGTEVTITLKPLTWSTGDPVTSRDVEFWLNVLRAGKDDWGKYSAGLLPDNVKAFHAVDERTFTLTLDKAYNRDWFTANQLSLVVPMPQKSWDRTSATGPVGDHDRTPAGAKQVFDFLVGQAKKLGNYATDPLWKVVNGPFALSGFTASGQVTLKKNPRYTGPDPAKLDTVQFLTFTGSAAEYNVLRAGGLDYGYVPTSNLGQRSRLEAQGYRVEPWNGWSITYSPFNFNNPELGKVFRQLYVRQALQHAVDQKAITSVIWRGSARVGYGPVPQDNDTKYLSSRQKDNPYPFDPDKSRQLLSRHGWKPGADGVLACAAPGTGPQQCGEGVEGGTRLSMTMLTESGSDETDGTMQELRSELSKIGVEMKIDSQPLNTVLANGTACTPKDASCSWQLSYFGTQGSWYFPANPSGDQLFATDAGTNFGSYSDRRADELIAETNLSPSDQPMLDYSAYLAEQLPALWLPNPPYQVSAIDTALHGVSQDPLAGLAPQRWFWTR